MIARMNFQWFNMLGLWLMASAVLVLALAAAPARAHVAGSSGFLAVQVGDDPEPPDEQNKSRPGDDEPKSRRGPKRATPREMRIDPEIEKRLEGLLGDEPPEQIEEAEKPTGRRLRRPPRRDPGARKSLPGAPPKSSERERPKPRSKPDKTGETSGGGEDDPGPTTALNIPPTCRRSLTPREPGRSVRRCGPPATAWSAWRSPSNRL